jgi:hypothetical protein
MDCVRQERGLVKVSTTFDILDTLGDLRQSLWASTLRTVRSAMWIVFQLMAPALGTF